MGSSATWSINSGLLISLPPFAKFAWYFFSTLILWCQLGLSMFGTEAVWNSALLHPLGISWVCKDYIQW